MTATRSRPRMGKGVKNEHLPSLLFHGPVLFTCADFHHRFHSVVRGTIPRTQNPAASATYWKGGAVMGAKIAFFCDANGNDHIGSDAMVYIDGRWSAKTIARKMQEYRNRYKKHFPHKYDSFTHYRIGNNGRPVPLTGKGVL